ncbi:MAG: hypothetical protein LBK95_17540 [Bifidobacteriaceae bacterium]|nr:hypothetical protein [Bifidobacteriaceae bacterium]
MKKRAAAIGTSAVLAGGVLTGTANASPAEASLACSGKGITINSNPGAESPSKATGHSHVTGNHYVRVIYSNSVWEWWADNNGGSDGDTTDTFYGTKQC